MNAEAYQKYLQRLIRKVKLRSPTDDFKEPCWDNKLSKETKTVSQGIEFCKVLQ